MDTYTHSYKLIFITYDWYFSIIWLLLLFYCLDFFTSMLLNNCYFIFTYINKVSMLHILLCWGDRECLATWCVAHRKYKHSWSFEMHLPDIAQLRYWNRRLLCHYCATEPVSYTHLYADIVKICLLAFLTGYGIRSGDDSVSTGARIRSNVMILRPRWHFLYSKFC